MNHHGRGRIEVITGGMFAGKTEELERRLRRAAHAKQQFQVFKPKTDNRHGLEHVTSHDGKSVKCVAVESPKEIPGLLKKKTTVVGIDEAQFFDADLVGVVEALASKGIRVIIAGLNSDFRREPFGTIPLLMASAEDTTVLHAICVKCGEEASFTQRIVNGVPAHRDDPIVLIGAQESYEARCRGCHVIRTD